MHAEHPVPWGRLGGVLVLAGLLAAGSAQAQSRYVVSADGMTVTDSRTGLEWQRCVAGLVPPGCTPSLAIISGLAHIGYNHEQALAYAATQAGAGWRLPNVKELSSLMDRSLVKIPPDFTTVVATIDAVAFPNTPAIVTWTSSPVAGYPSDAWNVNFSTAFVYHLPRLSGGVVRLVR